ncbi:MAG: insulinase family protein [Saprospiraceae bacterium]|nr:insulinase family protein [Saprospiraceae bacterium]
MKFFLPIVMGLTFLFSGNIQAQNYFSAEDIDIPFKNYTLDNGLRLIVHEDHKAPIVAVNVWYHVGSKNEKIGKSGFAHLFEHLMFNGSEHFDDDYFQALERIGGTDLNGTTNTDRNNYFQNVPLAALDQVLFLESDRMGHLLGAIDQEKLDEQRGVVQNEKRQGENQPYGRQYDLITKAMFPKGHPYSWTVIGEMEDLNAASLDDVHEWFKSYYGAANAVLSIAGDVNPDEIYKKVNDYFGNIPAGPTIARPEVNIPIRASNTREVYQDRVPESRIVMAWNIPEWGSDEELSLRLASMILASGKNSRLYKKLVYEDQVASNVASFVWDKEIASNFFVQVNVKPGNDVSEVEAKTKEVIEEFLREGPTQAEMDRVKSKLFSGFIKGVERIGGFGGKSDVLAECTVYGGDPGYYKTYLKRLTDASSSDIKKDCNKWLNNGSHTLICNPFPKYATTGKDVDRSVVPVMGEAVGASFPDLQETTLSNGLKVVLAQRAGVPTVIMRMMFEAGYASDDKEKAGLASLSMNMLDEGTKNSSSLEISEKLEMLGASLSAYSQLDYSNVAMTTLMPTLDPSLDIMADVLLNPAFPQKEFDRLQKQQMAGIAREKSQPVQMALRVMPNYLYGEGHPYSLPFTGSGFENTVESLSNADVEKFYADYIRPNNATLVVVGDIDLESLKNKLESKFSSWKQGDTPIQKISRVEVPETGKKLYLMDRPESEQSIIISGQLIEPYGKMNELAQQTMMDVYGGQFTSRLNMNLREDKHWAYGAFAFISDSKGQRPLFNYAPVQTDKTKESVQEILKEIEMIRGPKPITKEEFEKTVGNNILQLPGRWETNSSVGGSVVDIVQHDLDKDYYKNYDSNLRGLNVDQVRKMAGSVLKNDGLSWVIVGDKEKILPGLQELGFQEIILIDSNGEELERVGPAKP